MSDFWGSVIQGLGGVAQSIINADSKKDSQSYGDTEEGFLANLAAQKEREQIQAEAALQAAGMSAGATKAAAAMGRDATLRANQMSAYGNAFDKGVDARRVGYEWRQNAARDAIAQKMREGESMSDAYINTAAILAKMLR